MPFRKDYFQQKKIDMILLLILNITLLIDLDSIEISIKPIKGHNHVDF